MYERGNRLYDPKCYELAEHFLNPDATPAMKEELADWIQFHVELRLYDETASDPLAERQG